MCLLVAHFLIVTLLSLYLFIFSLSFAAPTSAHFIHCGYLDYSSRWMLMLWMQHRLERDGCNTECYCIFFWLKKKVSIKIRLKLYLKKSINSFFAAWAGPSCGMGALGGAQNAHWVIRPCPHRETLFRKQDVEGTTPKKTTKEAWQIIQNNINPSMPNIWLKCVCILNMTNTCMEFTYGGLPQKVCMLWTLCLCST